MSWRRFGVILRNLPIESRYMTAVRNDADPTEMGLPEPGVFGPWSQSDMLLARAGDALELLLWQNSGDANLQKPRAFPRPGTEQRATITDWDIAYLEYLRAHQGEAPPDDWAPPVDLT